MTCTVYTVTTYLESKTTLAERIIAIDELIDRAILAMADTVGGVGAGISTYELNDGQIQVKTGYRSIEQVRAGVKALEEMKSTYVNRLNGRGTVLRDRSTF